MCPGNYLALYDLVIDLASSQLTYSVYLIAHYAFTDVAYVVWCLSIMIWLGLSIH